MSDYFEINGKTIYVDDNSELITYEGDLMEAKRYLTNIVDSYFFKKKPGVRDYYLLTQKQNRISHYNISPLDLKKKKSWFKCSNKRTILRCDGIFSIL